MYISEGKQTIENPSHIVQSAYKCHILQHFPEHSRTFPFSDESTALVSNNSVFIVRVFFAAQVINYQIKPIRRTFSIAPSLHICTILRVLSIYFFYFAL